MEGGAEESQREGFGRSPAGQGERQDDPLLRGHRGEPQGGVHTAQAAGPPVMATTNSAAVHTALRRQPTLALIYDSPQRTDGIHYRFTPDAA